MISITSPDLPRGSENHWVNRIHGRCAGFECKGNFATLIVVVLSSKRSPSYRGGSRPQHPLLRPTLSFPARSNYQMHRARNGTQRAPLVVPRASSAKPRRARHFPYVRQRGTHIYPVFRPPGAVPDTHILVLATSNREPNAESRVWFHPPGS